MQGMILVVIVVTAVLMISGLFFMARLWRALEERGNVTSKENWIFAMGFASILASICCVIILLAITSTLKA